MPNYSVTIEYNLCSDPANAPRRTFNCETLQLGSFNAEDAAIGVLLEELNIPISEIQEDMKVAVKNIKIQEGSLLNYH